jgi:hypothetical protein
MSHFPDADLHIVPGGEHDLLSASSYRVNAVRVGTELRKYEGASGAAQLIEAFATGKPAVASSKTRPRMSRADR